MVTGDGTPQAFFMARMVTLLGLGEHYLHMRIPSPTSFRIV